MRDRETERNYYPQHMLSLQAVARAVCVAPHPDDEVFGCGGLLALLAQQGTPVRSLVLTGGDKAQDSRTSDPEHARQRRSESGQAASILGTQPPRFLDFEDRHLAYSPALVQAIASELTEALQADSGTAAAAQPLLLLLPSLAEAHPDHQAAALAGLAAAQAHTGPLRVLFYEVGTPQAPNTFLDITSVAERKWQAVAVFGSQLGIESYESHARAFASLRAFGLPAGCTAAEAYFEVDLDAVRKGGPLAALPQWPWVRQRLQLANAPSQLPLVSVLIRSMDRASLTETLASVALQTHANLEVVVVNASGHPHSPLHYAPEHLQLRVVQPSGGAALGRAAAANFALEQARGELALFLDDDDLIDPDHLSRLVQTLHAQPRAVAAYTGVRVVSASGEVVRDYDIPWSAHRLAAINFLPIHAVLFRLQTVREHALRFDPDLPVLEDWDFWHQLAQDREFVHCPGVSALYRQGLGQSGLGNAEGDTHWKTWHLKLLQKYVAAGTEVQNAHALAWHAIELDRLTAEHGALTAHNAQALELRRQQRVQSASQLLEQQSLAEQERVARLALQQELDAYSRQVRADFEAQQSQMLAFARESQQALASKEAQLQAMAEESRQALDAKEAQLQTFAQESRRMLDARQAQLQAMADEHRQALASLQDELQRVQDAHRGTLQSLEVRLQHLQGQLDLKAEELQAANDQLDRIYASFWWRWARPLLGALAPRAHR